MHNQLLEVCCLKQTLLKKEEEEGRKGGEMEGRGEGRREK